MDEPLSNLLDSEVQTPRGDIGGFDDSLILTPVFNNSEINEVNVAGRHGNDDGPGESDEFALDYYINGGKQQQRQQGGAGINDQRNMNENNFYFEDIANIIKLKTKIKIQIKTMKRKMTAITLVKE